MKSSLVAILAAVVVAGVITGLKDRAALQERFGFGQAERAPELMLMERIKGPDAPASPPIDVASYPLVQNSFMARSSARSRSKARGRPRPRGAEAPFSSWSEYFFIDHCINILTSVFKLPNLLQ